MLRWTCEIQSGKRGEEKRKIIKKDLYLSKDLFGEGKKKEKERRKKARFTKYSLSRHRQCCEVRCPVGLGT
jgi:hypothetical protein